MEYALVAVWVIVFAALAAVGLPIAARVFSSLPGRGAGFSISISLVILTLVAFWVGHLTFGPVATFSGVVVLVVAAGLAYRGGVRKSRPLGLDGRAIAGSAGVFLVAFLFFVAVRAVDPGVTPYHEEFINFGLINAVLRADRLPPEDMWFANAPVIYYYGGHLATALLIRLTDTTPAYAYNLALAGFYALLVTGTFELAGTIAAGHGRSRELAGVVAAVFVGFSGNLLTAIQVVLWALPDAISRPIVDGLAPQLAWRSAGQLRAGLAGFNYYLSSRIIKGTVNEFPLVTWINGQLHANLLSTPFLLLTTALCFAYYRTPQERVWRRRGLIFGAIPLVVGMITMVNLWSLPATVGLTWLALTFAPTNPLTLAPERVASRIGDPSSYVRREITWTGSSVVLAAGVLVGVVVALPVLLRVGGTGASIALVGPLRSGDLPGLLIVHGAFLTVFVAYLRTHGRVHEQGRRWFVVAFVLLGLVAWLVGAEAVALFAPLLLVSWYVLRTNDDLGFETVLLVAGLGLVLVIEFLYVDDPSFYPGRQNTVYKVYMQTWVLWSVAVGVMVPAIARGRASSWSLDRRRVLGVVFAVLVIASVGLYGGLSSYKHFSNPAVENYQQPTDPTLDGLAFGETNYPNELAAIHWLDNRSGTPTLVSAPGGPYAWIAPAATYTGIPTIAGWWHAAQYHGHAAFEARTHDVAAIYAGAPERRVELLKKYGVNYVYLGPTERKRYDVRPFAELDGLSVAYRNDAVTIYRVAQGKLGYTGAFRVVSKTYAAGDFQPTRYATRSSGRIVSTTATDGQRVWNGPYTALPPGNYTATFRINARSDANATTANATTANTTANATTANTTANATTANATTANATTANTKNASAIRLVVTADAGNQTLASASIPDTHGWKNVRIPFGLDRNRSNIEFVGRATDHTRRIAVKNVSLQVGNATLQTGNVSHRVEIATDGPG